MIKKIKDMVDGELKVLKKHCDDQYGCGKCVFCNKYDCDVADTLEGMQTEIDLALIPTEKKECCEKWKGYFAHCPDCGEKL